MTPSREFDGSGSTGSRLDHPRSLLVLAALRIEASAVRRGARSARIVTTGMGPARARLAVERLIAEQQADAGNASHRPPPFAVVGCAGGLGADQSAGDVVVASEVRGPSGTVVLAGAELLAAAMRRAGLRATAAPIISTDHVVKGAERAELAATGAAVVDMESAWMLEAAGDRPTAVVRVVLDVPGRELPSVWTVPDALRCYRALVAASAVLEVWAGAAAPRDVFLAGPRSFCAGVDRAIDIVERAIDRFGAPVFVRKQIVHNSHVVTALSARGAVFVEELDEVPDGATVVFSAHGVAPAVRAAARVRGLHVIDATCPLVAKVHAESRRFVHQGYSVVLIGHSGHDETEGTLGEDDGIQLVEHADQVDQIEVADPKRVAYLTQTTLAPDETADMIARLAARFPELVGPASADICYATQNRQDAVREMATDCELMLVIGSANSSNSNRLVEVAQREGCTARLIDDETDIRFEWLRGVGSVGVTAGASAPEPLVARVVEALASLGPVEVVERPVTTESVQFALPAEVR